MITLEQILSKKRSENQLLDTLLSNNISVVNYIAGVDVMSPEKSGEPEPVPESLLVQLDMECNYSEKIIKRLFANSQKLANSIYASNETCPDSK